MWWPRNSDLFEWFDGDLMMIVLLISFWFFGMIYWEWFGDFHIFPGSLIPGWFMEHLSLVSGWLRGSPLKKGTSIFCWGPMWVLDTPSWWLYDIIGIVLCVKINYGIFPWHPMTINTWGLPGYMTWLSLMSTYINYNVGHPKYDLVDDSHEYIWILWYAHDFFSIHIIWILKKSFAYHEP